jgi:hypothetical protein
VVLRAVLINPLINRDILERIVYIQNNIGIKLIERFEPILRKEIV